MEQDRKPRNKLTQYGQLIYYKGGKNIQGEKTISSISGAMKTGQLPVKKMKLEHSLTPYTKINSKWIKNLNVRADTIKLLEENIDTTLFDPNRSNIFLDLSPKIMEIKVKINEWGLIKLKSSCGAKEATNKRLITKQKSV